MKKSLLAALWLVSSALAAIPPALVPVWTEVAPGVWKTTVGTADSLTLRGAAGGSPARAALARLPAAAFPVDRAGIEGRTFNGKTSVRFPLGANEDIYGLGVDFSSMRRNGGVVTPDPAGRKWSYGEVTWAFMTADK